jgi:hypothetical protein
MAFTSVGQLVFFGTSAVADQASLSVTFTSSITSGQFAVLIIGVDNNQTTDGDEVAVTSITATGIGNTWVKAAEFTNGQGSAQAGATCSVWYLNCQASSGSCTVNFSNSASRDASAAKGWIFNKSGTVSVETTATLATDAAVNPASLDATASSGAIEYLRVRAVATEDSDATAATATAGWTIIPKSTANGGTDQTSMQSWGEFRIFTGTTAASAPTRGGGGTRDHASVYVIFKDAPAITAAGNMLLVF